MGCLTITPHNSLPSTHYGIEEFTISGTPLSEILWIWISLKIVYIFSYQFIVILILRPSNTEPKKTKESIVLVNITNSIAIYAYKVLIQ